MTQYDAAVAAGCRGQRNTLDSAGNKFAKHKAVSAYIEAARERTAAKTDWVKADMLKGLRKVAEEGVKHDEAAMRTVAVQAIKQASRMLGFDAPQKLDFSITPIGQLYADIRAGNTPKPTE